MKQLLVKVDEDSGEIFFEGLSCEVLQRGQLGALEGAFVEIGKEKAEKIIKTVKKRIKKKPTQKTVKKSAEIKKESSFPLVEPVKESEELVKEILEEVKPVEEEKTEIKKFVGHSTEISIPKPKESKGKYDWSAQRFKELDEKLKKLRRF